MQCALTDAARYYTRGDAEHAMRFVNGTRLDDRIIRTDWDAGFKEGRQFGRGKSGGQVRRFPVRSWSSYSGQTLMPGLNRPAFFNIVLFTLLNLLKLQLCSTKVTYESSELFQEIIILFFFPQRCCLSDLEGLKSKGSTLLYSVQIISYITLCKYIWLNMASWD